MKSIAVALACTVAAVVVQPAGGVNAEAPYPLAVLTSYPPANEDGLVTCQPGSTVSLDGRSSIDPAQAPLTYEWTTPLGVSKGFDLYGTRFPCDFDGTVEVSLRVITETGFDNTATLRVTANAAPVAVISAAGEPVGDYVDVEVGSSITLSASASYDPDGGALKYDWYSPSGLFDASPGEGLITVACDQGKLFDVGLTVTDDAGLEGTAGTTVNCFDRATASFSPEPAVPGKRTFVAVGSKVTFTPANPSYASDWRWRTTGVPGVASSKYEFVRTFDKLGDFGVELTESNSSGRATKWVGYTVIGPPTVSVKPAPRDPKARMTVTAGSEITFDGSGSRSPGGGSLTYEWRTTGKPGVVADSKTYSRRFDTAGNFGVELTVINELGQRVTRWVGLTVVPAKPPVASVTPAPEDPSMRIEVTVGETVTFDGRASNDPDGGPLVYQWRSTGVPGIAGTGDTYARRFDQVGNFGVELVVIDDEGQRAKHWVGVTVVR